MWNKFNFPKGLRSLSRGHSPVVMSRMRTGNNPMTMPSTSPADASATATPKRRGGAVKRAMGGGLMGADPRTWSPTPLQRKRGGGARKRDELRYCEEKPVRARSSRRGQSDEHLAHLLLEGKRIHKSWGGFLKGLTSFGKGALKTFGPMAARAAGTYYGGPMGGQIAGQMADGAASRLKKGGRPRRAEGGLMDAAPAAQPKRPSRLAQYGMPLAGAYLGMKAAKALSSRSGKAAGGAGKARKGIY